MPRSQKNKRPTVRINQSHTPNTAIESRVLSSANAKPELSPGQALLVLVVLGGSAVLIVAGLYYMSLLAAAGSTALVATGTAAGRLNAPPIGPSSTYFNQPPENRRSRRAQAAKAAKAHAVETKRTAKSQRSAATAPSKLTSDSLLDKGLSLFTGLMNSLTLPDFPAAAADRVPDLPFIWGNQVSSVPLEDLMKRPMPNDILDIDDLSKHLFAHCMQGKAEEQSTACIAAGNYYTKLALRYSDPKESSILTPNLIKECWNKASNCFASAYVKLVHDITPQQSLALLVAWGAAAYHTRQNRPFVQSIFTYIAHVDNEKYKSIAYKYYAQLVKNLTINPDDLAVSKLEHEFLTQPVIGSPYVAMLPFHLENDLKLPDRQVYPRNEFGDMMRNMNKPAQIEDLRHTLHAEALISDYAFRKAYFDAKQKYEDIHSGKETVSIDDRDTNTRTISRKHSSGFILSLKYHQSPPQFIEHSEEDEPSRDRGFSAKM